MKYNFHIADEAHWDIEEAVLYYQDVSSERIVRRFLTQIRKEIRYIGKYPLHFSEKYGRIRICNLKRFPYQIHFFVEEKVIKVIGVFHSASDPSSWEDRLND